MEPSPENPTEEEDIANFCSAEGPNEPVTPDGKDDTVDCLDKLDALEAEEQREEQKRRDNAADALLDDDDPRPREAEAPPPTPATPATTITKKRKQMCNSKTTSPTLLTHTPSTSLLITLHPPP